MVLTVHMSALLTPTATEVRLDVQTGTSPPVGGPNHPDSQIDDDHSPQVAPQTAKDQKSKAADGKLAQAFAQAGLSILPAHVRFLAEVYPSGATGTPGIMRSLYHDGVLAPVFGGGAGSIGWTLALARTDPAKLGQAIHRLGAEGARGQHLPLGLSGPDLARGIDRLLGQAGTVTAETARHVVSVHGDEGRISAAQIALAIGFADKAGAAAGPAGSVLLTADKATGQIKVMLSQPGPHASGTGGRDLQAAPASLRDSLKHILSFAEAGGGVTRSAFAQALTSLPQASLHLDSATVGFCHFAYAQTSGQMNLLALPGLTAMVRDGTLSLSPKLTGGPQLTLRPGQVPLARLARRGAEVGLARQDAGRRKGKDHETFVLVPALAVGEVLLEQYAVARRISGQPSDEDDAAGDEVTDTGLDDLGQPVGSLGLNATIFGLLVIDADNKRRRLRPRLMDIKAIDLTKLPAVDIARAIFRQVRKDPEGEWLSDSEFATALQELVGNPLALCNEAAEVHLRIASILEQSGHAAGHTAVSAPGEPKLSFNGAVMIFESKLVEIAPGAEAQAVVVRDNHLQALGDPQLLARYFGSFATNPDHGSAVAELQEALMSFAFLGLQDSGGAASLLSLLLAAVTDPLRRVPQAALQRAATAGAFPASSDQDGGLRLDLSRLPTGVFVDAMFHGLGLDPETDGLTHGQLEGAIERIAGSRVLNPGDAEYLAQEYASALRGGARLLTRADVLSIFAGELALSTLPGVDHLRILNTIDPQRRVPAFANPATWPTGFALAGAFANDLVRALASDTGLPPATVKRIIGNVGSWDLRHPGAGDAVAVALRKLWCAGSPEVSGAVSAFIRRILDDQSLSASAKAMLAGSLALIKSGAVPDVMFLAFFWSEKSLAVLSVNEAADFLPKPRLS